MRTLKGIPQPTALCPVGDFGAAVLCRREIRIIDLNKGVFRVCIKSNDSLYATAHGYTNLLLLYFPR